VCWAPFVKPSPTPVPAATPDVMTARHWTGAMATVAVTTLLRLFWPTVVHLVADCARLACRIVAGN